MAKRLDSVYEAGRRSGVWRKIKIVQRQEFVIGGWIPERGTTQRSRVGALLLGYYDCPGGGGKLHYAGSVGSGFSDATHRDLTRALAGLGRKDNPFAEAVPKRGEVIFLDPKLVGEVDYRRWPDEGHIQQASFKGLREDKDPREVVKEGSK